jgi:hypothetical protein
VADKPAARRQIERRKEETTEHQAEYAPASNVESVGTLVPRNMATPIAEALEDVQAKRGDLVKFAADSLALPEKDMGKYFSAEQVDGLALAIHSHKEGSGFILGDQTGVGKGRVAAGMLRYAQLNDMLPVFVTQQPALFGDMVRDLTDIGQSSPAKPFNPLPTNTLAGQDKIPLPDGRTLVTPTSGQRSIVNEAVKNFLGGGKLEAGGKEYGALFTTYSQLQSVAGKETWRHETMRQLAKRAFIVLDESHEAGGTKVERPDKDAAPSRAEFIRSLVKDAAGVMYSSATYAKRPDVMDLYSRTDMAKAVDGDLTKLAAAIEQGGVPLQQVTANMLAQVGQYIRRERTFAGVKFAPHVVPVDLKLADQLSESFRAVRDFDTAKADAVEQVKDNMVGEGGGMGVDTSTGGAGVTSTNFASIMWNVVDQMLLSLKTNAVVDAAVKSVQEGKRPVIVVDNTMEAVLDRFIEGEGIKKGEPVPHDFKDLVGRYLERSREVVVKDSDGNHTRHYLTDEELGPQGVAAYKAAQKVIDKLNVAGMPISPIDFIIKKLKDKGLNFAEVTGRNQTLDYQDSGPPLLSQRDKSETGIRGKIKSVKAFNDGDVHGILMNRSASTGLSLHSSPKFGNIAQRHMIIAQAAKNIDTFMQMLGRVHRTGQVVPPEYTLLLSDAPAENRPAAVLVKKLASLNASVTASSKGAVGFDVPDIINRVGDQVVGEYLQDNPEVARMLDLEGETPDAEGKYTEDIAAKATGRAALMPVKDQHAFWTDMMDAFETRIKELNAINDNPLVAQTMDLDAKTVKESTIFPGDETSDSPFAGPATLHEMDVKRQGKPYTSEQLRGLVGKAVGGEFNRSTLETWQKTQTDGLQDAFNEYRQETINRMEDPDARSRRYQEAMKQAQTVYDAVENWHPGAAVEVKSPNGDTFTGYVVDLFRRGQPKNPAANSAWNLKVAVTDAVRELTIPLSRIGKNGYSIEKGSVSAADFDHAQSQSRETRYVATGNLLAAFAKLEDGRIINYSDHEGKQRQGILMPKKFTPETILDKEPEHFDKPEQVLRFLQEDSSRVIHSTNDQELRLGWSQGRLMLEAPKSKLKGGKYTLNKPILNAAGQDFISSGSKMRMFVDADKAPAVLKAVMKQFQLGAFENKDEARAILGKKSLAEQVAEFGQPADDPTKTGSNIDVRRRGMATLPDLEPAVRKIREQVQEAGDALTSKVIPKLTRFGAQPEAVAVAKYRTRVNPLADDLMAKVMPDAYKDAKAVNALGDILNKDNILHGYKQAIAAQDADAARAILGQHPIAEYRKEVLDAMADPTMRKRIERWKEVVNPVMDELYKKAKALDPATPLPERGAYTGARVNLVDVNHLPKWMEAIKDDTVPIPESNASSYRNPDVRRDKFDRAANFLGDYSTDLNKNLRVMLAQRLANTTRMDFYNSLQRRGAVIQDKGGTIPDTIRGKPAATLEVKVPQTDPETHQTSMVLKDMIVPRELVPEIRGVLGTDLPVRSWLFNAVAKPLNTIQMVGLVDGIVHTGNLLKTVGPMAGSPSLSEDLARRVPGLGLLGGVKDLARYGVEMMKDSPEIRAARAKAAEQGVLRGYYPSGKMQPLHHVIQFVDEAMRLAANDKFDMLVKRYGVKDTPENRYEFVSQLGEYSRRLRGPVEQAARDLGLSPFIIAGRTMNAGSRRMLFGAPGVSDGTLGGKVALRALGLSTLAAATALPALVNLGTTGSVWGRPGTPVGAIDTGKDDDRGNRIIWDVWQLAHIRRGARSVGLNALVNGVLQGKNAGQIVRDMATDIAQTALHPYVGPAPAFAVKVATGKQPDIRGRMEAQRVPGGGPAQIAENFRAAMESQQPLLYNAVKPVLKKTGIDKTTDQPGGGYFSDLLVKGAGKPAMSTVGATSARPGQDAAEDMASRLAREKFGDLGLTADEQKRLAASAPIVDALKKDPKAGRQMLDDAVEAGQISERQAALLEKKAGASPLQWNVRQLTAKDAVDVWAQATPAERETLRDMVQKKIQHSSLDNAEQDELFASTGIERPADIDLRREMADLTRQEKEAKDSGVRFTGSPAIRLRRLEHFATIINNTRKKVAKGNLTPEEAQSRIKITAAQAKKQEGAELVGSP